MYEELVKELRAANECLKDKFPNRARQMKAAADAIEELQKCLDGVSADNDSLCQKIEELSAKYQMALNDLCREAHDKPRWIPVTERLPEREETVLVVRKFMGTKDVPPSTYVETAELLGDTWVSDSDEYKISRSRHTEPLFWMPLPSVEGLKELDSANEMNTALYGALPKWIPVTERLPKTDEDVLVYLWDRPYIVWVDSEGQWNTNDFCLEDEEAPKEWTPLPKPPKEET